MDSAVANFLGACQFIFMAHYNRLFPPERRFTLEQIITFFSYISLLGLMNFHVFHISSFSTTGCMTNQILESFILTSKENYAYSSHDLKHVTSTFDTKDFFENQADIFFFRIVDRVATYRL